MNTAAGTVSETFGGRHSLRRRLFLILLAGLLSAHALSFTAMFVERDQAARAVMLSTLQRDVAVSIALLDRLPAAERPDWLPLLARPTYRFALSPDPAGTADLTPWARLVAGEIRTALAPRYEVRFADLSGARRQLMAYVILGDGSTVAIDASPAARPLEPWLLGVLSAQLLLVTGCTWLAVRLAIRPLTQFAAAADALDPGRGGTRFPERGPEEVVQAARAFNAMQERIARHLDERVRILAAISHDLQTPITRMRLRVETGDEGRDRDVLLRDLDGIEGLVREGIAYARSVHGDAERPARVDLRALVESLVFDYQDIGRAVTAAPLPEATIETRPRALRRILTNLVDNALRYAGAVELRLEAGTHGPAICVLDRGPGIPPDMLEAVLQPFVRLEDSRGRDTGGTGLGLAIAHQLASAIGGALALRNRAGGGLAATVTLTRGTRG